MAEKRKISSFGSEEIPKIQDPKKARVEAPIEDESINVDIVHTLVLASLFHFWSTASGPYSNFVSKTE